MKQILFYLFLLTVASAVQAGDVRGVATLAGHGTAGQSVVYLEGGAESVPMRHAMVDQRDKMFTPHISVVTKGTTVQFPNDDTVFHNVFAYFQAKKFDLGMYPRGASKQVTFDRTGLVVLLCNVHSDMSAYILVVDTPFYAIADKSGHFHMANVPPGTYTLKAWHESGAVSSQTVTVGSSPATLNVTLARQ